jgi:NADH:ubiquinone oxidoreductase subunit 2 (subunit N)
MTGLKLLLLRWGFSLLFGAAGLHMARVARRVFMRQCEWKEKGIVLVAVAFTIAALPFLLGPPEPRS